MPTLAPSAPRETADRPVTITMTWTEALSWFDRHRVEVEAAYHDPRARAWVFIVKPVLSPATSEE